MDNVEYAGFWRRVPAILLDVIILWIPASLFRWIAPLIGISGMTFEIVDFIYLLFIWGVYYGFMESSRYQATLGKQILRLKVVNYKGGRISFNKAICRYLGQFISILPLGIGIFMIGWTKKKQGIHDMLAKCLIIRKRIHNP